MNTRPEEESNVKRKRGVSCAFVSSWSQSHQVRCTQQPWLVQDMESATLSPDDDNQVEQQ